MKSWSLIISIFLSIIILGLSPINGQTKKLFNLSNDEINLLLNNRTKNEKKMNAELYLFIKNYDKNIRNGIAINEAVNIFKQGNGSKIDRENRIMVICRLLPGSNSNSIQEYINKSGGLVEQIRMGHNHSTEMVIWMPILKLIDLLKIDEIGLIEQPIPMITDSITTAGYQQLKAIDARVTFNTEGENIKIGVMSDGCKSKTVAFLAEELDAITEVNPGSLNGDEGTAMMEIIHDLAPKATLFFSGLGDLQGADLTTWGQRINGLVDRGCKIIVDDVWHIHEPFYSDESDLGTTIRNFISAGGVYIGSAGNGRKKVLTGNTNFSTTYHIFPNGNDYIDFNVTNNTTDIVLQWATSWLNPSVDLDLEVYNMSTQQTLVSDYDQSPLIPPYESLVLTTGNYRVKIKKKNATNGVQFKIVSPTTEFVTNGSDQIFGHHAYPNVISVAAYQANDESTTSDYSSIGSSLMYSVATNSWTTFNTPTITATSGVETYVGVNNIWSDGYPVFSGTSASAPHIAGLAALYFNQLNEKNNRNKTNLDFIEDLKKSATAIGIGTTGGVWNNKSGSGKANILAAIIRGMGMVATPQFSKNGGTYYQSSIQIDITCSTEDAAIWYTMNGSEPDPASQTSYLYDGTPITITGPTTTTLKAKAFKNGYGDSFTNPAFYELIPGGVAGQYLDIESAGDIRCKVQYM